MVYVNNNEKLADLLENLLKKDLKQSDITDARDLIIELRSPSSNVSLIDRDTMGRRNRKYMAENL